ncbi:Ca-activated chloride channel family protein [Tamaricihabitans halophyticus]|uniref:Ca-activated chloride channel family protein n=1 Tax=Tamaricihabitans halophyticus TaxID=1262583 RepID=A0A4R2QUZ4_9PSEU|nr:VWA domain-containing protein [Tamaricihabitans halophyticus]TCP50851.1 Ca-activated chloride channel family protein [Tamaricihabitans halophyticus]
MLGLSLSGFTAAWWLVLLAVVVALAVGYVLVQRRRRKRVLRFSNLELLEKVAPARPHWVRHVPPALLLVALVFLTVALAGPTAEQKVPRNRATVMLAMDVSLSMEATDVQPTRLRAAQASAKSFAGGLTSGVNLGLISFAGTATVAVSPTTDRESVKQGIDGLKLTESTATGEAIFAAIQTIQGFSQVVSGPEGPPPAHIVLMTDGKQTVPSFDQNAPRGAFTAARAAKEEGIPVSTISFGTVEGVVDIRGNPQPVPVDDASMEEIARISGGDFYRAETAGQLDAVYDTLGEQIGYEMKEADASKPWLLFGTVAALIAAAGALTVNQRLP